MDKYDKIDLTSHCDVIFFCSEGRLIDEHKTNLCTIKSFDCDICNEIFNKSQQFSTRSMNFLH